MYQTIRNMENLTILYFCLMHILLTIKLCSANEIVFIYLIFFVNFEIRSSGEHNKVIKMSKVMIYLDH